MESDEERHPDIWSVPHLYIPRITQDNPRITPGLMNQFLLAQVSFVWGCSGVGWWGRELRVQKGVGVLSPSVLKL